MTEDLTQRLSLFLFFFTRTSPKMVQRMNVESKSRTLEMDYLVRSLPANNKLWISSTEKELAKVSQINSVDYNDLSSLCEAI